MSPELISIHGRRRCARSHGLYGHATYCRRIDALETRIEKRIDALEGRIDGRLEGMETRFASLEKGQARLEGLLDGLREALFDRAHAKSPSEPEGWRRFAASGPIRQAGDAAAFAASYIRLASTAASAEPVAWGLWQICRVSNLAAA